ncbi:aminomethyl-transferring glycine dehydrogenase subunit GcvPB [bacterium]|nr:aminomethyl-transferring glycine dehydrogenase subunit GcvPB [bacterium]MBU1074363.1 aminomethyl-transferring glycine dehydrogenase subunit GcvPB [bacterium]MBU1675272.1 aminomethyl-transferring glycine dehydrogenase subunit GcvPB [bacterium]
MTDASKCDECGRWGADLQDNLFAKGGAGRRGVMPPVWHGDDVDATLPASLRRAEPCDLPSLSEPEVMRHYTRLSILNHHIERGMYPLGSCTMKYNPRLNERVAALPGFATLHPEQDEADIQGLLCACKLLQDALCEITGFDACSLQPAAGAHGEFLGMLTIRAFHLANGDADRLEVLIPDSAHGTNPASVVMAGMKPVTLESRPDGRLDLDVLRAAAGPTTAGIMITNPNTLGLFETDIVEVARIVHEAGGRLYMDGANLNAILGKAKPAHMGFDVVHLNLHKTFSTPHGGGGPGAGPICVVSELAPYLPGPEIVAADGVYGLVRDETEGRPSIHSFYGNIGVCLRALAYILRLGGDGLTRVAERAVLNANYLRVRLEGILQVEHGDGCLHEFIASGVDWREKYGVRTLDIAKRLLDYGVHAPTIYFPLIVEEALMIEPTETESKETLDAFVEIMRTIRREAEEEPELLHQAPLVTPVSRLDEAGAARKPDLRWLGPCNCG